MANHLKMAVVNVIITLKQRGWSMRRIARELGVDRITVKRHVLSSSNPASNASPGPETGSDPPVTSSSGPDSRCEP